MSSVNVSIKWGKNKYDVPMNLNEGAVLFKTQIWTLTGVPPERQKYVGGIKGLKGGKLEDDADLKSFGLKDRATIMLVGTAGDLPKEPPKTIFIEDMSDYQKAELLEPAYPAGLQNLGNTCYLNSALQCLKATPELNDAVLNYAGEMTGDDSHKVTVALRELLRLLSKSSKTVNPFIFVPQWRTSYPQFAERGDYGYMQQDAEEAWTQLGRAISQRLPTGGAQLFKGEMLQTYKCVENSEETPLVKMDEFQKLSCHCDKQTDFLLDGLKKSLREQVSKFSPSLNRESIYELNKKITQLPYYLCVQFVRFYWKPTEKVKAKVTKSIEFPHVLDVVELCSDELQAKLKPVQEKWKELDTEKKRHEKSKSKRKDKEKQETEKMQEDDNGVIAKLEQDPLLQVVKGKNQSGLYELYAIVSHKGRSADGGHYVAWVKRDDGVWLCYDDETVFPVDDEKIKDLQGRAGADWHIAYLLFYKTIV